jgi:alpha-mannosidase
VDSNSVFGFNELRGYFYEKEKFFSSKDTPAKITLSESNDFRKKVKIESDIFGHLYTQTITLTKGQERIDFSLFIDWKENIGIGEYKQENGFTANYRATYDDRYKLHIVFPTTLIDQQIYKNAPFDVCKSTLDNTFFKSWDSIKHNIILNWVDVLQGDEKYGLALLSDHTTSYLHGNDYPLGLTAQYSGYGLWDANYKITQPLNINYALIPHTKRWDESCLWTASTVWNEPLITVFHESTDMLEKSFIRFDKKGYELSAVMIDENDDLIVRMFNAEGNDNQTSMMLDFPIESISEIELNGKESRKIDFSRKGSSTVVQTQLSRLGIKTFRIILT